ncbi:MAG: Gfo/Idh/MocA family oxidoreductase [bacterium]
MNTIKISRRDFVKTTGLAIGAMNAIDPSRVLGANDRVNVGIIGPGSRGGSLMKSFHEFSKELNMELNAVCDLWKMRREKRAEEIAEWNNKKPRVARNTEELYELPDLDAVIIATPDFSHALVMAEAVRAGKDVYVEKPLANVLEDAKIARETVLHSDRIVQIGTQRRSSGKYIGAVEYLRSGAFGEIVMVEMHWNVNQPLRWRRQGEVTQLKEEDTDWKRYLLNRPYEPFDPRKYLEFRLFWPYSSGLPDQWMSHQIDTVAWFADDPYPESVVAQGSLVCWKDGRQNPDTFSAIFKYPKGFLVNYTARQTNSYGGTKELYFSNGGMMDLGTGEISGEGGRDENRLKSKKIPSVDSIDHMKNWMECIRSRKTPNADIEAGYSHAVAVAMAIKAMQTGKRVAFDREKHEIILA